MTETTTTTDKTIEEMTNSGEVTIPSPTDEMAAGAKKAIVRSNKATPRATRAKSTSKRKKPTKVTKSTSKKEKKTKTKETKAKATKPKKATPQAKDYITVVRPEKKTIKPKPTKETKEKAIKEKEKTAKPIQTSKAEPTFGQLSMWHQLVLYTMRRMNREATYEELGDETGFSRAVLRKAINAQIGNDSLVSRGLVTVNQYEAEDGESFLPYYFQLTDAGKKLVRQ